jgi:predicted phage terminase large subunit-like protein
MIPPDDIKWLHETATRAEAQEYYKNVWAESAAKGAWGAVAELGKLDRFFLLTWLCNRPDANRDWIYHRCREVERDPDDYLDLWAREHYKSTVITFAGVIQEILRDPDITVGLFSFSFTNAKNFVRQIKREFEVNERLKNAYPSILYKKPEKDAPQWSEEKGIVVKRRGNPKEATVTPHGLIEGLPAGPHYRLRVYDDIITEDHVSSPEMMQKAVQMWRQSQNLGKEGGRRWHAGTRYHFNDPYSVIINDSLLRIRTYPATDDSTPSGRPVLVSSEYMSQKYRDLGPYLFACQWLLNPVADDAQGFRREWVKFWTPDNWESMNRYILVDPASEKKKTSDYTVMWVVGLGSDRNFYLIDGLRDRLNLTERADSLFSLHRKYKPLNVGYEKYGQQADIEHMQDRMGRENYRFPITPLGGSLRKEDRIRKMVPLFQSGRVYLPEELEYLEDGRKRDLIKDFVELEYMAFPVSTHDDMLDCLARIADVEFPKVWPQPDDDIEPIKSKPRERYRKAPSRPGSWMTA